MAKDYIIHTPEEIVRIREASQATAWVRDTIKELCQVGMSTGELNRLAGELIQQCGAKSATLGYYGYPGQICISLNEEVVHGIGRADRIIEQDDIVSVDVTLKKNGACGDCALTFPMRKDVTAEVKLLLEVTEKALYNGIAAAVPGNHIRDISKAIEETAKTANLGVVRDMVGHGCGIEMHEPPEVPNFVSFDRGPKLQPGMVLAIEPMFTLGTYKIVIDRADKWTVRTRDGKWSAHFEHTVLITDNGPEILTWQKTM